MLSLSCIAKVESSVVTDTLLVFKVEDLPGRLEMMNELCHLPRFRHNANLIEETGIDKIPLPV